MVLISDGAGGSSGGLLLPSLLLVLSLAAMVKRRFFELRVERSWRGVCAKVVPPAGCSLLTDQQAQGPVETVQKHL